MIMNHANYKTMQVDANIELQQGDPIMVARRAK